MVRQTRTLEQKLQNVLRDCQKRDGNKRCADCIERVRTRQVTVGPIEGMWLVYAVTPCKPAAVEKRLVCCTVVFASAS